MDRGQPAREALAHAFLRGGKTMMWCNSQDHAAAGDERGCLGCRASLQGAGGGSPEEAPAELLALPEGQCCIW